MDQVTQGEKMGVGDRKVIFFSCSNFEPGTCALVGESEIGVGGGVGVGILPRSILKGFAAVGKQVGVYWFSDSNLLPT